MVANVAGRLYKSRFAARKAAMAEKRGTESLECEAVVIGAGVVGLAVARALAMAGHETVILERTARIGSETSSRNSEVIHAGLYPFYPQGSLKGRLCVAGRKQLYDFAASHGVPHRRIGKWLVATNPAQLAKLEEIQAAALGHGVTDLTPVAAATVRAEEPLLRFIEVVTSPSTGIIDSHAYMLALLGEAEAHGARLAFDSEVEHLIPEKNGWRVTVRHAGERLTLAARLVVNSAGLHAQTIARAIEGLNQTLVPPLHLAKGSYAAISGAAPFKRLIYPMPEPGGLGVHLTLDMAGQGRLGPDVEWLGHDDPSRIDYAVRNNIAADFAERARDWWPDVQAERLSPAYAGVRPRIAPSHQAAVDFRIDGPGLHGLAGLVNLFGIESPGLTASLAIGDLVASLLKDSA